jgi:hypothetical protein
MIEIVEGAVKHLQAENILGKELSQTGFARKEETKKPET